MNTAENQIEIQNPIIVKPLALIDVLIKEKNKPKKKYFLGKFIGSFFSTPDLSLEQWQRLESKTQSSRWTDFERYNYRGDFL